MQIKVDFLCRDSILAAPLVLDLAIFSDLAQRAGLKGIQEWLSFYFKSPQVAAGLYPEHDLFIQQPLGTRLDDGRADHPFGEYRGRWDSSHPMKYFIGHIERPPPWLAHRRSFSAVGPSRRPSRRFGSATTGASRRAPSRHTPW
jgi:hypothetical protein